MSSCAVIVERRREGRCDSPTVSRRDVSNADMTRPHAAMAMRVDVEPPRRNRESRARGWVPASTRKPTAVPAWTRSFRLAGALLRINPDDQHARRSQEMHQPVERGFERLDRMLPPVDESHVVLTGGRPQFAVVATRM